MSADGEAQEHQRRRKAMGRRLARVEAAISQWHDWEAKRFLPPAQQRALTKPAR